MSGKDGCADVLNVCLTLYLCIFSQASAAYQLSRAPYLLRKVPQQMVNINCVLVVTTVAHLLTFV